MRRQNHIVLIGQRRGERIAGLLGLDGEYVHGRAGKMPGIKMPFQRVKVGDEAAGQVDDCSSSSLSVPQRWALPMASFSSMS